MAFFPFTSNDLKVLNKNSKCSIVLHSYLWCCFGPRHLSSLVVLHWGILRLTWFTEPTACFWGRLLASDIPASPWVTSGEEGGGKEGSVFRFRALFRLWQANGTFWPPAVLTANYINLPVFGLYKFWKNSQNPSTIRCSCGRRRRVRLM